MWFECSCVDVRAADVMQHGYAVLVLGWEVSAVLLSSCWRGTCSICLRHSGILCGALVSSSSLSSSIYAISEKAGVTKSRCVEAGKIDVLRDGMWKVWFRIGCVESTESD